MIIAIQIMDNNCKIQEIILSANTEQTIDIKSKRGLQFIQTEISKELTRRIEMAEKFGTIRSEFRG